jgi:hypothetical protein
MDMGLPVSLLIVDDNEDRLRLLADERIKG